MLRKIVGVVVAITLVILLAPGAHAQDAVSLRLALAQGEILSYAFAQTLRVSLEAGSERRTMDARAEGREVHRVIEAATDGSMRIEIAYEDLTLTSNGTTTHPTWPSVQVRVQTDGTVVSETVCGCGEASYPIVLPPDPVAIGASWTKPFEGDEAGATVRGTTTFTLVAIEQTADGRVARIRTAAEGTISGADLGPMPSGTQAGPAQGRVTSDGEAFWSVDRGRLLSMTTRADVTLRQEMTVRGEHVRMAVRVATTNHRELNSPEARTLQGQQTASPQDGGTAPPAGAADNSTVPDPVHRGRD